MKIGLTSKLFLGILATSVLVAIAMGAAARFNFTRGFIGYLNEQGVERMEGIVPTLAEAYREHGNWDFVRTSRRTWIHLLRPPRREDIEPDQAATLDAVMQSELTGFSMRLALLDETKQRVTGNPEVGPDAILRPVVVNGQAVGWLALLPIQNVTTAAELRFQQQQLTTMWVIGGLAVLIAAAVAMLLARTLMSPVRRIAQATHRLAGGGYDTRVSVGAQDALGRLSHDFNQLAQTLERNEAMRRDFIADISHELRTPIAVLRAELEALHDGIRPLSAEAIDGLQSSVVTLGKLVDDLHELSLSDVGALSYRKQDLDPAALLADTLRSFEDRLAERRLLTDYTSNDAPRMIHGDADRLRQLFSNLIENSVRHTDPGGRLKVSYAAEQDWVRIELQDSAPGVPDDALPRLFERFYRVDRSRNRDSGGAGLGLAICRNIVEAHNGTIAAQPSTLGGLKIVVRLPCSSA